MIDLPSAADDLRAAVAHHGPDLDRIRGRVRRRQRRRRAVGAAAAVVLLAAGAASAAAIVGDDRDASEDVVTEPGPTTPGPIAPTPEDRDATEHLAPATQLVDHGNLRITVPADWTVQANVEGEACGGPTTIVLIVYPRSAACDRPPAIEVTAGEWTGRKIAFDAADFINGIPAVNVTSQLGGERWAFATLDATLELSSDLDDVTIESILSSIGPSARHTAMADLESEGLPLWAAADAAWRTETFGGISIQVPWRWEVDSGEGGGCDLPFAVGPPRGMQDQGAGLRCLPGTGWRPTDGVWVGPLAGTEVAGRSTDVRPLTIGGLTVGLVPANSNVLEVTVDPGEGRDPLLLRVGLGVDGHVAASVIASIRPLDSSALVLPCGPVVVVDRSTLELPVDLDVEPVVGVGGWPEDRGEDPCAFHLTNPDDPARHVTFGVEELPFAQADGADDRPRDAFVEELGDGRGLPRWGSTFGGGFGAQFRAADGERTLRIVAIGITEAEAEALFTSLRRS